MQLTLVCSERVFLSICVDYGLDENEVQLVRYKPEGLDSLCRSTKFTRKELQVMYRGFKQVCYTFFYSLTVMVYIQHVVGRPVGCGLAS
jgi:hypothetical protein